MSIKISTCLFILEDILVYPFMAHSHTHVFFHPTVYVFRRPVFSNQSLNKNPGPTINTWIDFTFPLFNSLCMSLLIAISMLTTVSLQLSTCGWLMYPYNGCNLWLIMLCFSQRINSVSMFQREPADSVSSVLLILVGENGGDPTETPPSLQTVALNSWIQVI